MENRSLNCVLAAICGATVLSVLLSISLYSKTISSLQTGIEFVLTALVLCTASSGLATMLVFMALYSGDSLRQRIKNGIAAGIFMSAFCYFSLHRLPALENKGLRLNFEEIVIGLVAFCAIGSLCGAWIGWQAWRATNPEVEFWPRFSLGTLMILVFAWGLLLAVFAPK